jgi:hypothetical protein
MKVNATKLLIFFVSVTTHFLWLIVQLIMLREAVTTRSSTEAKHNPKNTWRTEQNHSGLAGEPAPEILAKYQSALAAATFRAQPQRTL